MSVIVLICKQMMVRLVFKKRTCCDVKADIDQDGLRKVQSGDVKAEGVGNRADGFFG